MPTVRPASEMVASAETGVIVIGGGACGLTAALRAHESEADVIVIERDASPSGSTAMSSGFVPAGGTRFQQALDIEDSPAAFAADIQKKASSEALPELVEMATRNIAPALEWLADRHGVEWIVLDDFLYPGHSRHRMHAVPEKTGEALMARLLAAVETAGIPVLTRACADTLYVDGNGRVAGVSLDRPDGETEIIACTAVILACNGFGGNSDMVSQLLPYMNEAVYFGHPGNQGDALAWGKALGARSDCLEACQGHGSLAHPHGVLITWALMMEGAIQVNSGGQRFSNEHGGYSEQAVHVLAQPDRIAWNIYDQRLHEFALDFPDYRDAEAGGAIVPGKTLLELSARTGLPLDELRTTLDLVADCQAGRRDDPFGRDFTTKAVLQAPYHAVRVTGALFHTQGGLMIDSTARVLLENGDIMPNLFAGGGAACGVSGYGISGYLSGNGLLTAIAFGWVAGQAACRAARSPRSAAPPHRQ